MAALLSGYAAALKEILLPYIQDNFPKATILLDQVKKNAGGNFINDEFIAPVRTTRHGGIANLNSDANSVISSSGAAFGRGTVLVKRVSGAFDISDLVISASKSGQGAIAAALSEQANTLSSDFARHINRQIFGDGVGIVGQVNGSVSGTEFSLVRPNSSLDDGRSLDWYGSINGDIAVDKYMAVGNYLAVGSAGSNTGTVVGLTGTSVQFTGAIASVANQSLYLNDGSKGVTLGTAEFGGIRNALSSTTGTSLYASLPRSTVGWTPQFGSVAEALTLSRMELSYLKALEFARTGDRYAIFVNRTLYKKYGDILTSMRRVVNSADLLGGWKGLEFAAGGANVGVFLDYDTPDGEIIVLNLDSWTLCQIEDLKWLEDPNANSLLRLQNTTTYQAVMVWYANVMCLAPAANGRETQKTG